MDCFVSMLQDRGNSIIVDLKIKISNLLYTFLVFSFLKFEIRSHRIIKNFKMNFVSLKVLIFMLLFQQMYFISNDYFPNII